MYRPLEIVSKDLRFKPEDLIEHRLVGESRKVKYEQMCALNGMLDEIVKHINIEQFEDLTQYRCREYIQRLHLWIVPANQIRENQKPASFRNVYDNDFTNWSPFK